MSAPAATSVAFPMRSGGSTRAVTVGKQWTTKDYVDALVGRSGSMVGTIQANAVSVDVPVTFSTPFPAGSSPRGMATPKLATTAAGWGCFVLNGSESTTGFTVRCFRPAATSASAAFPFNWSARTDF